MHPPLTRFDRHGRLRLGKLGYPTASVWHPLYADDALCPYVAVCFSDGGGIKLYEVRDGGKGVGVSLCLVQHFSTDSDLTCMAWSPDGRFLAVGEKGGGNTIRLLNVTTNQEMVFDGCGHTGAVTSVDFSPDSRLLVSGSLDTTVRVWAVDTGIPVPGFGDARHEKGVTAVCFNPNGETILSAGMDNVLRLWLATSGEPVPGFSGKGHDNSVTVVSFSSDGSDILSGGGDDRLHLWDAATGQVKATLSHQGHEAPITSICFSPGAGHFILSAAEDNNMYLWKRETHLRVPSFNGRGHQGSITSARISPDGGLIISTSEDGVILLRDLLTGKRTDKPFGIIVDRVLPSGHEQAVTSLCFAPDGQGVYSASWDQTLKCWGGNEFALTWLANKRHEGDINAVCCSPDGRALITAGEDETLRIWEATTGKSLPSTIHGQEHDHWIHCLAWSPDGRYAVSGDEEGVLLQTALCKNHGGRTLQWKLGDSAIKAVAYSPDAAKILVGGKGLLRLLDAAREDHVYAFQDKFDQMVVHAVGFCPEGKRILVGSGDGLQVRELPSGKLCDGFSPQLSPGTVGAVAYCPTGRHIAVAGNNNTVHLLHAVSGETVRGFSGSGHHDSISALAFSPDGTLLATASHDRTLILWSLEKILGPQWYEEHMATPLIVTAVRFPAEALDFLEESGQGAIVRDAPLARCGECGKLFPVKEEWLGTEIRCPMENEGLRCGRRLRLNGFVAMAG